MTEHTHKGIRALPEDVEWARLTFAGRLTNDRSLPRLDTRVIDQTTGEILGRSNDLRNLGKARAILDDSRLGKAARCGMRKLPAQGELPPMLAIATPCPDKQVSQHIVLLHADQDWEVKGVIPRPGGPHGKPRVELVKCQYERWAQTDTPRWKDEVNKRGWLNAAAYNQYRASRGWQPMFYSPHAEKHLLAAWERERNQRYCVPTNPETGEPFDWVYEEIATGRRIELTSWDRKFTDFSVNEPAAIPA
jgi:hypothetical protein